jgi:pathogenesis-related protein 1
VTTRGAIPAFLLAAASACSPSNAGEAPPAQGADSESAPASGGDRPPQELAPLLDAHNQLRAKHCAPPLTWSEALAHTAKRWADTLGSRGCVLEHSHTDHGENLAGGTAGALGPEEVARVWYGEREHYDFGKGGFSMHTGHFTQLVWVGTRHLGCAVASCKDREVWVCNYDPPGNVEGDYRRNVLSTSCGRR